MTVMDKATVARLCKEKDLFRTPSLNDKLFLHFQG